MKNVLKQRIRSDLIRYFSNVFKQYRTKHELSQETFARMLKISCRSYVDIEK